MALTSAVGVLSLLEESDPTLVHYGLAKLEGLVPTFWAEISDALTTIEDLAEDVGHDDSQLASLVASKVYFHLGDLEASLSFALGAGPLFQLNERSEYVHTLASKAIDEYVAQRVVVSTQTVYAATSPHASPRAAAFPEVPDPNAITDIDDRLTALVERMFETSFNASEFHEAVGIAMDAMRIDLLKRAITGSNDVATFVGYALDVALSVVKHREFRRAVLAVLIEIYGSLKTGADSFGQAQCSLFLSDTEAVSALLLELIRGSDDDHLVALQLAFDLVDDAPQSFLAEICGVLAGAGTSTDGEFTARLERLNNILSGEPTIDLFLRFLYRNNNTDLLILNTIKEKIPERNAVLHEATCFAHSFMQAGTTNDSWLRSNIDWLSRATNWSKFSATAGLGVIHKGHYAEGLNLLAPYLPGAGAGGSPYSQGGALFGLGLINANHGADVTPFLCDALRNAGVNPVVQHGACLGIGLAAMATGNEEIYNQLKEAVLYTDETVAAAAAALSMGLVMLGTANERAINELIAYGRDTSHVKITRAVAMGVAFIMFGREESCDVLTDELGRDQDPLLRTCAMWTLALGFVATANNSAVRKLLHFAVSDVDDEVRRSAVLGLGFVLANTPDVVPATVALLATSFNPHVRYGAAMAVGVACAGTASTEALDLLETLWKDQEDFVRQGALLATSMVLVQTNAAEEPRVQTFRDHIAERSADKREELLTKFGSILAAGVIDAGGRNVTISLRSRSGHTSISAAVGLTLFCQGWYWYPYHHMLSLAFMPTAVVGLDASLAMPKFSFASNAPPSRYAYPDPTKPPEKKVAAKVEKAVLSTAKRSAANAAAKQDAEEGGDGDVADMDATPTTGDEPMPDAEADGDADEAAAEEAAAEPEATSEVLENPTRVTPRQVDVVSFSVDERFVPIKLLRSSSRKMSGILVLKDNTPDDDIEYVAAKAPAGGGDDEPEPPAQFVYVSDDED